MSKIQAALEKATGLSADKGEARADYLARLIKATSGLSDAKWNALPDDAADWFNGAADAKNAKKDIPEMPDYEAPKEDAPRGRRRSAEADEEKAPASTIDESVEEGDTVVVKTTRGKIVTGEVVEIKVGKFVALKVEGEKEEIEMSWERLEAMTKANNAKDEEEEKPSRRRKSEDDDEPQGPKEPEVGDTVTIVTKRGKTIKGKVTKVSADAISIDDGEEDWDFDMDRVESVAVEGAAKASARSRGKADDKEEEKPARGRASAKDEPKEEGKRASNPGVSVGERIRELIIDDQEATVEEIGKALKKEGLAFKDNTLELNYKEAHKFLKLLAAKGKLKK